MGDVEEMIGELEEDKEDPEDEEVDEAKAKPEEGPSDDDLELDLDSAWGSTERDE